MRRIRKAFVACAALALVTLSTGPASAEPAQQEVDCNYELCLFGGYFYGGTWEAPHDIGSSWCQNTAIISVRSYVNSGSRRFTLYSGSGCTGSSDEIYPGESDPVADVLGRSVWYCPSC